MNKKGNKLYYKLSHDLALKHLLEKFVLELSFSDSNISLDKLISDSHNIDLFSNREYKKVYKMAIRQCKKEKKS